MLPFHILRRIEDYKPVESLGDEDRETQADYMYQIKQGHIALCGAYIESSAYLVAPEYLRLQAPRGLYADDFCDECFNAFCFPSGGVKGFYQPFEAFHTADGELDYMTTITGDNIRQAITLLHCIQYPATLYSTNTSPEKLLAIANNIIEQQRVLAAQVMNHIDAYQHVRDDMKKKGMLPKYEQSLNQTLQEEIRRADNSHE